MSVTVTIKKDSGKTPGSASVAMIGARIPREMFQSLVKVDEVLREASTTAEELMRQAAQVAALRKQQAHAEGLEAGRREGMAQVLGAVEFEHRLRQLLSQRLAGIVERCVRDLLGEMDGRELMQQRIQQLIRTAGAELQGAPESSGLPGASDGSWAASLYVCPAEFALARAAVDALESAQLGAGAGIQVIADERRAPDSLLLEARWGFVESNLVLTLAETRQLVESSLAHALGLLGEKR